MNYEMFIEKIGVENLATFKREEFNLENVGKTVFIQGPTGAGKTTFFIDAVTFALFGRAYGQLDKSFAKELIPPNQVATKVDLYFEVNKRRYKVVRKIYSIKNKPSTAQLFEIKDTGRLKLVADSVKAVDKEIEKITGLDFRSFKQTNIVRQGEVAELISKDFQPSERRDIFLRVFGISFKKEKEEAGDRFKSLQNTLQEKEKKIKEMEEEIGKKSEIEEEMKKLKQKLHTKLFEIKEIEKELAKKREEVLDKQTKYEKLSSEVHNLKNLLNQLEKNEKERNELEKRIKELKNVLEQREKVKTEIKALEEREKKLNKQYGAITELKSKEEIMKANQKLLETFEKEKNKLETIKRKIKGIKEEIKKEKEIKEKISEKEEEKERIQEKINELRGFVLQLEQNLKLLEESEETRKCPLCGSHLPKEKGEEIKTGIVREMEKCKKEEAVLKNKLEKSKRELKVLKERFSEIEKISFEFTKLKEEEEEIKGREEEIKRVKEETEKLVSEINELKRQLLHKEVSLQEIKQEINELNEKLINFRKRNEEINKAEGELRALQKNIERLNQAIETLSKKVDEEKVRGEEKKLSTLKEELEKIRREEEELTEKNKEIYGEIKTLQEKKNSLQKEMQKINELETQLLKEKKKFLKLEKEKEAYKILYRQIFHDKGLPLHLLKTYLSHVETYSRKYLTQFLDDKDLKIEIDENGNVKILVIDQTYARDITTYSGGETVLIGFALRLGIINTLSLLKGINPPKFLIIDEGFGPLSREFRESVLAALKEISDQYEKVLVISHLEDIENNPLFQTHVKVFKEGGNSKLEIQQRGK